MSVRRSRPRLPARTIRLRLTVFYGGLFLASGTALLTITYFLVRRHYTSNFFLSTGNGAFAKAVATKHVSGMTGGVLEGLLPGVVPTQRPTPALVAAGAAQSGAAMHQLLVDSAFALAIMAVISIWLGWVIAGRALRPLRTITNTAREISANNLHRRLALKGPDDELTRLGNTFDDLLQRLEAAFTAQRQFVANASHELRTPLTLERTLLEVALDDPNADVESLRKTCEEVLAAGTQQERLIEALLTLSRSQRGLDQHEPVDLAAITGAAVAAVPHPGLAFDVVLEPADTQGDPRLVDRLVANLISNAAHHNVPGGHVDVTTASRNGHAVLAVANTGPQISTDDLDRLFLPFQRLGSDRTKGKSGNGHDGLGLGLSIVDAVARTHRATITTTALPEGGLQVEVAFPSARQNRRRDASTPSEPTHRR